MRVCRQGAIGWPAVAVFSIALIALLTYADALGYFFTATDTFTLIDTSRVSSGHDVLRLLSQPLMAGAKSEDCAKFYRPMTALTYSLDYQLWGLDPFGYHLTNLLLHVAVALLAYFVVRSLLPGEPVVAWLSAAIFSTHPILVEAVPGVAPRQELLVTAFLLLSFLLFMRSAAGGEARRGAYLASSCAAYLLALGAKEIGVILPALVAAWTLASSSASLGQRLKLALRRCAPYLLITLGFLAWRTWVLRGLGGYAHPFGVLGAVRAAIKNGPSYFLDLLYPVDVLVARYGSLFSPYPGSYSLAGAAITAACLAVFALLAVSALRRTGRVSGRTGVISVLLVAVGLASLAALLAYPALAGYIKAGVDRAWRLSPLPAVQRFPVEYYYRDSRDIIIRCLAFSALASTAGLLVLGRLRAAGKSLLEGAQRRFVVVMSTWLGAPLVVYLVTSTFYHRCMYPSVIPFSGLLALLLVESYRAARQRFRSQPAAGAPAVCFTAALALSLSLLRYSPLLGDYAEWKDSGVLVQTFLQELSGVVARAPNDATIDVYDYPFRIASYQAGPLRVKECGYGNEYSTKAWLNLTHPANRVKVTFCSRSWPAAARPQDLRLEVREPEADPDRLAVFVRFGHGGPKSPEGPREGMAKARSAPPGA